MLRYFLIVALALFLYDIRYARSELKPVITPDTSGYMAPDKMDLARKLSGSIKIPTVSNADPIIFDQFNAYLKEQFPLVHDTLERVEVNKSLVYIWHAPNKKIRYQPAVMLCAHIDVVPIQPKTRHLWSHEPFSGAIVDENFIYGRGTLDFKNGVIGTMAAVESLLKSGIILDRTVILAYGHDEEVMGVHGAANVAKYFSEQRPNEFDIELLLDEGTPMSTTLLPLVHPRNPIALVSLAEKGYANVRVDLVNADSGGHASFPDIDGTLITRMASIIQLLHEEQLPFSLDNAPLFMRMVREHLLARGANGWLVGLFERVIKLFVRWSPFNVPRLLSGISNGTLIPVLVTTQSMTIIDGGVAKNVMPDSVSLTMNYRLITGDTSEKLMKHLKQTLKKSGIPVVAADSEGMKNSGAFIRLTLLEGYDPSPISPSDSLAFQHISGALKSTFDQFDDVRPIPSLMIAGTDTKHYVNLTKHIYRFSPVMMSKKSVSLIHGVDEHIGVTDFADYTKFFAHLLLQYRSDKIKE